MSQTYRAYVVAQSDTNYTIISERDKQYHVLPLPMKTGNVRLSDESIVNISEVMFNPSKMFSACREYESMLKRKRNQYQRRKNRKQEQYEVEGESLPYMVSVPLVNPFTLN